MGATNSAFAARFTTRRAVVVDRSGALGPKAGPMSSDLFERLRPILFLLLALWIIQAVNAVSGQALNPVFGLVPRSLPGLIGIPFMPVLHGSFSHLIANSVPLAVLGSVGLLVAPRIFPVATILIVLTSGIAVWFFARNGIVVGASGLIFGWFGFLVHGRGAGAQPAGDPGCCDRCRLLRRADLGRRAPARRRVVGGASVRRHRGRADRLLADQAGALRRRPAEKDCAGWAPDAARPQVSTLGRMPKSLISLEITIRRFSRTHSTTISGASVQAGLRPGIREARAGLKPGLRRRVRRMHGGRSIHCRVMSSGRETRYRRSTATAAASARGPLSRDDGPGGRGRGRCR